MDWLGRPPPPIDLVPQPGLLRPEMLVLGHQPVPALRSELDRAQRPFDGTPLVIERPEFGTGPGQLPPGRNPAQDVALVLSGEVEVSSSAPRTDVGVL